MQLLQQRKTETDQERRERKGESESVCLCVWCVCMWCVCVRVSVCRVCVCAAVATKGGQGCQVEACSIICSSCRFQKFQTLNNPFLHQYTQYNRTFYYFSSCLSFFPLSLSSLSLCHFASPFSPMSKVFNSPLVFFFPMFQYLSLLSHTVRPFLSCYFSTLQFRFQSSA